MKKWYFYELFKILTILDLFWTLFDPFLAFGYIWGQIPIDCHMRIYKLCKHAKNCTHMTIYRKTDQSIKSVIYAHL